MAGRYYIRIRGKRVGPMTVDRLQAMARRGRFGRHFEVSQDGRSWGPAGDYPELFPDEGGGADDAAAGGGFDNFGELPPESFDPYDAPPPAAPPPQKGRKRRSGRNRSGGGVPESMPLAPDEPHSSDAAPRRRRSRPASEPAAGGNDNFDLPDVGDVDSTVPQADPPPRRRRRQKEEDNAAPSQAYNAATSNRPAAAAPQAPQKRPKKKPQPPKKKGFFGSLFGGGGQKAREHREPHLEKLYRVSERLPPVSFGLDKLILLGSGGDEIRVSGRSEGIEVLGLMTLIAIQSRSTDMHVEPTASGADVRMRIDGGLVKLVTLPKEATNKIGGVVKVLCQTKMGAKQEVQEGNYSVLAPGRRADYRVSFTPSVHGQKLAIRVLDLGNAPKSVADLGAPPRYSQTLQRVMQQNAGMVLMCGPTGSGKTTTLYTLLRSVDLKTRNVMTLEDPVEYQVEGITQIPIDSEHGKGFSEMLPALMRQDPDVLLIGEIRDGESAKIAMQATMTGHLVLSTVHANDTLSTLYRLLDLNADSNMIGSALDLIMSQRLVKVLCEQCRSRRRPTPDEVKLLGRFGRDAIFEPNGCEHCLGTGFLGRRAIFELLDVKNQIGDLIYKGPSLADLRRHVAQHNFASLRSNGIQLVAAGVTSFSEVNRVIGVG